MSNAPGSQSLAAYSAMKINRRQFLAVSGMAIPVTLFATQLIKLFKSV